MTCYRMTPLRCKNMPVWQIRLAQVGALAQRNTLGGRSKNLVACNPCPQGTVATPSSHGRLPHHLRFGLTGARVVSKTHASSGVWSSPGQTPFCGHQPSVLRSSAPPHDVNDSSSDHPPTIEQSSQASKSGISTPAEMRSIK